MTVPVSISIAQLAGPDAETTVTMTLFSTA